MSPGYLITAAATRGLWLFNSMGSLLGVRLVMQWAGSSLGQGGSRRGTREPSRGTAVGFPCSQDNTAVPSIASLQEDLAVVQNEMLHIKVSGCPFAHLPLNQCTNSSLTTVQQYRSESISTTNTVILIMRREMPRLQKRGRCRRTKTRAPVSRPVTQGIEGAVLSIP